jgi:hypothetical protein
MFTAYDNSAESSLCPNPATHTWRRQIPSQKLREARDVADCGPAGKPSPGSIVFAIVLDLAKVPVFNRLGIT